MVFGHSFFGKYVYDHYFEDVHLYSFVVKAILALVRGAKKVHNSYCTYNKAFKRLTILIHWLASCQNLFLV